MEEKFVFRPPFINLRKSLEWSSPLNPPLLEYWDSVNFNFLYLMYWGSEALRCPNWKTFIPLDTSKLVKEEDSNFSLSYSPLNKLRLTRPTSCSVRFHLDISLIDLILVDIMILFWSFFFYKIHSLDLSVC